MTWENNGEVEEIPGTKVLWREWEENRGHREGQGGSTLWIQRETEFGLWMAADQLTKHSCLSCWNFGLISRRLFPQIILARHHLISGDHSPHRSPFKPGLPTADPSPAPADLREWTFLYENLACVLCNPRAGPFHLLPSFAYKSCTFFPTIFSSSLLPPWCIKCLQSSGTMAVLSFPPSLAMFLVV